MALPTPPESSTICTPAPLASALVRALGHQPTSLWLEPCVGSGVFLRALSDLGVDSSQIVALDLEQSRTAQDTLARTLRGVDFLAWSRTTTHSFDKIVANPPYVAIAKLDPALRQSALAVSTPNGGFVPRGSNYWYAFLCASLKLLRPGGDLGFVLPAAWDYADYAAPLRDSITRRFAHFEIHRSRTPMFDMVQDGCVVLIGRGFGQSGIEVLRCEHQSTEALLSTLQDSRSPARKSTGFAATGLSCGYPLGGSTRRLGDVMRVLIGGVTGDAAYFLLTESDRLERKLPTQSLRPVVSKARHLVSGELTQRKWQALRHKGERIWLLDPPLRLVTHPTVQSYLDLPPSSGGCRRDRYKIRDRTPWYRTPLPRYVDGFVSGMSQLGPWVCLRAMPRLTATNTLYTVKFHGTLTPDEKASWALSLLTGHSRRLLDTAGRVYPDGLVKYEPGDLLRLELLVPPKVQGARVWYLDTVAAMLSGDVDKARQMADHWFGLV